MRKIEIFKKIQIREIIIKVMKDKIDLFPDFFCIFTGVSIGII